eukprot:SAG31_NODE_6349_length_2052_cov_1.828469_2_plen_310_part_00
MIVYGQTGSGKTFTMFGTERDIDAHGARPSPGVVPTACAEVLAALEDRRADFRVELKLSYVEIYGDELRNLLDSGKVIGQDSTGRTTQSSTVGHRSVLSGECEVLVNSMAEVEKLLQAGDAEKRRAATAMNDYSTRAHAVIVLNLTQQQLPSSTEAEDTPDFVVSSKLFLADLGGSEKISKSHADDGSKPLVIMKAVVPPEMQAKEADKVGTAGEGANAGARVTGRGWIDADGNFIMQEGGGGMARAGEWEETSRISWAEYYASRKKMQETVNINQGLFALKRCIAGALTARLTQLGPALQFYFPLMVY